MKVEWNKKYTTIAIYAFLVIASSIIVYLMASQAEDLKVKLSGMIATMQPFIIGAAIAYIINFILNFYEKVIFELKYINKLNRKYIGIEKEKDFLDLTIRRKESDKFE